MKLGFDLYFFFLSEQTLKKELLFVEVFYVTHINNVKILTETSPETI